MPQAGLSPIGASFLGSFTSTLSSAIIQSVFHKDPVITAKSTIRAAVNDARPIIGRRRTGGQIIFAKVLGDDIHLAFALSEGSLDSILDFSIDGVSAGEYTNPDTGVKSLQLDVLESTTPRLLAPSRASNFHGAIEVREYFSADGTQGDELQAIFPEKFTDDHKKLYLSWVYIKLIQNFGLRKVWSKVPQISFLTRGMKITVPGQPIPSFVKDAASAQWYFLTTMREIPESAIPASHVMSAIALSSADTTVNLPSGYEEYNPTSVRYLFDGELSYGDNVHDIQSAIDFNWNGHLVDNGGQIIFRPGAGSNLYPVSGEIGEDDILERGVVEFDLQLKDKYNAARMSLEQSYAKGWEEQDLPVLHDRETQAIGDQIRILDLGTNRHTSNPVHAVRMMAATLREIRASATYHYKLRAGDNFENLEILPGDRKWIRDPENGLNPDIDGAVPFKVMRTLLNPDWTITVELREDPDEIYQDDPITLPLVPRALEPGISDDPPLMPSGVIVEGSHFIRKDDNSKIGVFIVNWEHKGFATVLQLTSPTNVVLPQVIAYGDTASLPVERSGTYKLDIWHENSYGVRGPKYRPGGKDFYVSTSFTNAPPQPTITHTTWAGRYFHISVNTHAVRDVVSADVRFVRADLGTTSPLSEFNEINWETRERLRENYIFQGQGGRSLLVVAGQIPSEGRYRIALRLINRAGQESEIANDTSIHEVHFTIVPHQTIPLGGDVNTWPTDDDGNASRGVHQIPRPAVEATTLDEERMPQNVPATPQPAILVPDHALDATTTRGRLDGQAGWLVGARADNGIWLSASLPLVLYFGEQRSSFSQYGLDITNIEIRTPTGSAIPVSSTGLDIMVAFSDSSTDINFDATAADRMLGRGTAAANVSYQVLVEDGVARHRTQQGRFDYMRVALRFKAGYQGAGLHSFDLQISGQI